MSRAPWAGIGKNEWACRVCGAYTDVQQSRCWDCDADTSGEFNCAGDADVARDIIEACEERLSLHRGAKVVLTLGQRRDLLKDNLEWHSDRVDAVTKYVEEHPCRG